MGSDQPIGRPAGFQIPPDARLRFKIGNEICEGSAIAVRRYRTYGGRQAFQLELLDPILIEGDSL